MSPSSNDAASIALAWIFTPIESIVPNRSGTQRARSDLRRSLDHIYVEHRYPCYLFRLKLCPFEVWRQFTGTIEPGLSILYTKPASHAARLFSHPIFPYFTNRAFSVYMTSLTQPPSTMCPTGCCRLSRSFSLSNHVNLAVLFTLFCMQYADLKVEKVLIGNKCDLTARRVS